MKPPALPLRARLIIFGLVLTGAAAIGVRAPDLATLGGFDILACVALAGAITLLEQFPVKVKYRTETWNFSLTDAVSAGGLLLVRSGVLTVAVGAGILIGHLIRRVNRFKVAFNVGQFLAGIWAAEAVFAHVPHGGATRPATWGVLALAMGAFFVVNASSVALIISVVEEKSFLSVLVPPLGLNVIHFAGNIATGVAGAVVWALHPVAVPLLSVPLVLSYFAYRAWVYGMRERDTMHHLYEAGRSLMNPLAGAENFREFLGHVQQMLMAPAAEIVMVREQRVTLHDETGSESFTADPGPGGDVRPPEAFVRAHPGLTTYTAVMSEMDGVRAVLAIHRAEALSDSERSLLQTLASQFAVRLQNERLFAQTVEQRTQLEEIIAHTSNGIFVVDPAGFIRSWNDAMERMTGFSAEEAVGHGCEEILGSDWVPATAAGEAGETADFGLARDVQLVTKDRVGRWIRYTANAILDRDGVPKASVVVAQDVTAELEAEQLKADFVATVSHELRTPLTPLKGFLSALLHGTVSDSPEARREYYRIMMNQADRLERLITDLLEVSRMESGDPSMASDVVELTGLVAEQIDALGKSEPGPRIAFHGPGVPVFVLADSFRLGQVVANLLSNALKYSPPGSDIDVTVDRDLDRAVVSVTDQGEGIPHSEQERVFERFQRLENRSSRKTGGTGLGLYIAKRFVEAMSGRLWLVSTPGSGSTFSFSLPMSSFAVPGEAGWSAQGELRERVPV